jgi:hypothetical protein
VWSKGDVLCIRGLFCRTALYDQYRPFLTTAGLVKIWDAASGQLIQTLEGPEGAIEWVGGVCKCLCVSVCAFVIVCAHDLLRAFMRTP